MGSRMLPGSGVSLQPPDLIANAGEACVRHTYLGGPGRGASEHCCSLQLHWERDRESGSKGERCDRRVAYVLWAGSDFREGEGEGDGEREK